MAYLAKDNVYFVFYYIAAPVLGISFCLMTVRLNLRARSPPNSSSGLGSGAKASGSGGSKRYTFEPGPRKVVLDPTSSLDVERDGHDASKVHLETVQLEETGTRAAFVTAGPGV